MKKISIAILAFSLSSCSTMKDMYDAWAMKYDVNEYQIIANIRTTAELAKVNCGDASVSANNAVQLYNKSLLFKNYTEFLPHDAKVKASAIELNKMTTGLRDAYANGGKVSEAFCKIKFEMVEQSAKKIQQPVGAKPR